VQVHTSTKPKQGAVWHAFLSALGTQLLSLCRHTLIECVTFALLIAVLTGWARLTHGALFFQALIGAVVIVSAIHVSLPIIIVFQSYKLMRAGQAGECYANLATLIPIGGLIWLYSYLFKFGLLYLAVVPMMGIPAIR
jgi:carbon starvation protein CstA